MLVTGFSALNKHTIIFLLFLCVPPALSGDEIESDITGADSAKIIDTTVFVDTVTYIRTDDLSRFAAVDNQTDFEKRLTQHPTVALVKSMVIPGLGQFGNKKYIKGLVYLGLDAWFVSSAIRYKRQTSDFRDKYEQATSISSRNDWYEKFEDRRDQRNKFTWFAVIVSFFSMFDAYTDAHLSGFPVLPDEEGSKIKIGTNYSGDLSASLVLWF